MTSTDLIAHPMGILLTTIGKLINFQGLEWMAGGICMVEFIMTDFITTDHILPLVRQEEKISLF